MAQKGRGCGCLLVVLALVAVAALGLYFKFYRSQQQGPPLPPASGGELQVYVLDVEQGDAILIVAPGGKTVLVDAGDASRAKTTVAALARHQVQQLDYFIATHAHPDHIGGAADVFKAVKVLNVLDSGLAPPNYVAADTPQQPANARGQARAQPTPRARTGRTQLPTTKAYDAYLAALKQSGAQYAQVTPGQRYDLGGGVVLTALAPGAPPFTAEQMRAGGNEPNANSVVLRLDYGDFSMLLCGDAEAQTEQRLLNANARLAARVLKVAHHGSKYATSEEFVRQVKPEAAIISVGAYNRYGQPAQVVLDRLRAAQVQVYRTDLHGELTLTSKGRDYQIKPAQDAGGADVYAGRTGPKDDSARSGFIAYGDFGPPPKPPKPPKHSTHNNNSTGGSAAGRR